MEYVRKKLRIVGRNKSTTEEPLLLVILYVSLPSNLMNDLIHTPIYYKYNKNFDKMKEIKLKLRYKKLA